MPTFKPLMLIKDWYTYVIKAVCLVGDLSVSAFAEGLMHLTTLSPSITRTRNCHGKRVN